MNRDDHYVAQTYLREFVNVNGDIYPYYKKGQVIIGKPKKPKAICFETNGDTNKYFPDQRILDKYLPIFENTWTENVNKIYNQSLPGNTKYNISGYIAFLRACTPIAKRLGQKSLTGVVDPLAQKIMKKTLQENKEISGEIKALLNKAIEENQISLDVDRDYAHALGIDSLMSFLHRLYCSSWLVLKNETNTPFITSDYPATLYYHDDNPQYAYTYIPVKPNLAILVAPDLSIENPEHDDVLNYPNSNDSFATIKLSYVKQFNSLVVKSAEKLVIHSSSEEWLEKLVIKYKDWMMDTLIDHLPTENGLLTVQRQRPVEISRIKNLTN